MSGRPATRPNIVYFHSHDTGRYIQPYGHAVPTPNYQRLAEEGITFRNAHCAGPTCSPSRAALMLGQAPHSTGMMGLVQRGFQLEEPSRHLATTLRDAGYSTNLAGIQHVIHGDPTPLGFTSILPTQGVDPGTITGNAVSVIRDHATNRGQPFYLDVGYYETHRTFPEAGSGSDRYVRPPIPVPDTAETRRDMANFIESARILDEALGQVLQALDETGCAESTIVIATTDHGVAFPRMKCNLTDHGTGVLLILRGPAPIPAGVVTDALVSQIDVYATMCGLLGIPEPEWLQGTSLLPVFRDPAAEVNDAIFSEVTYHGAYEPQRSIRTHRWTYIERFTDRSTPVLSNCDLGPSRDLFLDYGWSGSFVPRIQLYDNLLDPAHGTNLAGSPGMAQACAGLRGQLVAWMERTNDPLLLGDVALPTDAMMNEVDSSSFRTELIQAVGDGTFRRIPFPGPLQS